MRQLHKHTFKLFPPLFPSLQATAPVSKKTTPLKTTLRWRSLSSCRPLLCNHPLSCRRSTLQAHSRPSLRWSPRPTPCPRGIRSRMTPRVWQKLVSENIKKFTFLDNLSRGSLACFSWFHLLAPSCHVFCVRSWLCEEGRPALDISRSKTWYFAALQDLGCCCCSKSLRAKKPERDRYLQTKGGGRRNKKIDGAAMSIPCHSHA